MDRDMVIYAIALAILGVLALTLGFEPAYAYSSSYEGDWLAPTGYSSTVTYYSWSEPVGYYGWWYPTHYDWTYYPVAYSYPYYGYYQNSFGYSPVWHSYYFWAW